MEHRSLSPQAHLRDTAMNATSSSDTVLPKEGVDFNHSDVEAAIGSLLLTWVNVGDYLVIMNSESDVDICGEPYLAMQLWLNLKSGKFIARIWNQTTARGRAVSIAHFVEACQTLFRGRPCIGCPANIQELDMQDHFVLHTPVPRKISAACHKFLGKNEHGSQACPKCLSLSGGDSLKFEMSAEEMCSVEIKTEDDDDDEMPTSDFPSLKTESDNQNQNKRQGPNSIEKRST